MLLHSGVHVKKRSKELVSLETVWSIVYMLSQWFDIMYALQSTPLPPILFIQVAF